MLYMQYVNAFRRLNRGNVPGTKEHAPHKPVMLLAVIDEITAGGITGKRIFHNVGIGSSVQG